MVNDRAWHPLHASTSWVKVIYNEDQKIKSLLNLSYRNLCHPLPLPWYLSWTVYPFEIASSTLQVTLIFHDQYSAQNMIFRAVYEFLTKNEPMHGDKFRHSVISLVKNETYHVSKQRDELKNNCDLISPNFKRIFIKQIFLHKKTRNCYKGKWFMKIKRLQ